VRCAIYFEHDLVMAMTDARKIIADARATVARITAAECDYAEDAARREWSYTPLEREPPQSRSNATVTHQTPQPSWDDWNEWAESHVARGLQAFGDMIAEELGAEAGLLERRLLDRIEKLESEIGELKAADHVRRSAEVFDLPNWRTRSAA
jgi:hypothetical protein